MALPNYSSADSVAAGGMTRRQVQRERKQYRRDQKQERRKTRRITNSWGQQEDPNTATGPTGPTQTPMAPMESLPQPSYPGFQGSYVAPDNSYEHPFYTPNATYARPGELHYQLPQGSKLQEIAIEQNPAGGYYGWAAHQGYGGMDAKSQAVQGMYKDFATGYEAAKLYNNFEGNWQDYMDMQDIPHLLEQMTNAQLGIDQSQFRGRDRWSLRGQ